MSAPSFLRPGQLRPGQLRPGQLRPGPLRPRPLRHSHLRHSHLRHSHLRPYHLRPDHLRPRSPCSCPEAGFTLVEALVAMTLMGLVLTGLALLTGQWLPGWSRGLARVQQTERLALAIDRMAADLSVAAFVPANVKSTKPLFAGSDGAVTFVRTGLGPNARPGLEIVTLAPAATGGIGRSAGPYVPRPPDAPPRPLGAPVPLLDPPYRIAFSYAGRDGAWRSDWSEAEELPRAVRLVVRDGGSGRALAASTAVVIAAEVPRLCVTETTEKGCAAPPPGQIAEAPPQ